MPFNTAYSDLYTTTYGTFSATSFSGAYSRDPVVAVAGPPNQAPLAVPVTNTTGNWMFAVVSWRQDAGVAGVLQYPSSVNVTDDAGNFWIPVQPGAHQTGIVRSAIWMAPAARAATTVFFSPASTAQGSSYQAAITALVFQVAANCPWYSVQQTEAAFTNQGTTITLSTTAGGGSPSGLYAVGVVAYDNSSMPVTTTATGWTAQPTVTTGNGNDSTGDLTQLVWTRTTPGGATGISASRNSGALVADWAEVIIVVHGVTDTLPYPYGTPALENWPVLLTEIAAGPVLNANPLMLAGTANWTGTAATLAAVTWPTYNPWPSYQAMITPSLSITPSGSATAALATSEPEPVVLSLRYNVLAYVYSVAGYAGGAAAAQLIWYDSSHALISVVSSPLATILPGTWTQLTLTSPVFPPNNAAYGAVAVTEAADGLAGVFLNQSAISASSFSGAVALWTGFTGDPVTVTRVYYALSSFPVSDATLTYCAANGIKCCIDLKPAYSPVSSTDLANLAAMLAHWQGQGLPMEISLWAEPFNNGLTAAQFIAMFQYYGPAVRAAGVPVVFCTSAFTVVNNNENSYYPGDSYADKVTTDFYVHGGTLTLDQAASVANNASPPKPFGIWEYNSSTGTNQLTGDSCTFSASNGNWTGAGNATTPHVSSPAYGISSGSMAMTSVASGDMAAASAAAANFATQMQACSPGDEIVVSAFVRAAVSPRTCAVGAAFYNNVGGVLTTTYSADVTATATDSISGWTGLFGTLTAPASSAWCRAQIKAEATGAASEVHYAGLAHLSNATVNGQTKAAATTFFHYVQSYMAARAIAGRPNADTILFSGGAEPGTNISTPVSNPGDYRVPLWQAIFAAGNPALPSSAVLYVGYAALGVGDAYEFTPLDDIAWTDISARNFTQGQIQVERGIQYEQQTLEAGTMTINLDNNDAAFTFGNVLSTYWPNTGDTDVPIRLRAVWPGSLTPYYPMFTGYTDQVVYGLDQGTRYAYAEITASDAWSRLTQQLLGCVEQEVLSDAPAGYWTCNASGANLAVGNNVPVMATAGPLGSGTGAAQSFTSAAIQLLGDPGVSCWQVQGVTGLPSQGYALTYFPSAAFPPVSGGVTVEFWLQTVAIFSGQPLGTLTACACWGRRGLLWSITINNSGSGPNGASTASVNVYDQATGARTTQSLGSITFLGSSSATSVFMFAVTFTQTSLTVTVNPGAPSTTETKTVSCNLSASFAGFSFAGNAGPIYGANNDSLFGFMNAALYGIAYFSGLLPLARLASHYAAGASGFNTELDTSRVARVTGYSGFVPVLAAHCLDLPAPPAADLDILAGLTDTTGQVVSGYLANVAATTLAGMYVGATGALYYRRRLEWYNRAAPQWVTGDSPPLPLNSNPLNIAPSVTGWAAQNSATLTSSSQPAGGPLFFPYCGLMRGNGSVATPQIAFGAVGNPVTAGQYYTLSAWVYCPQGWASGIQMQLEYYTAGNVFITTSATAVVPLAANSLTYLTVPAFRAPATAALAALVLTAQGTPATTVQFFITDVVMSLVPPALAGGAGATAPEAPYLVDVQLSSDRALLFNQAVLTQYGNNLTATFTGTGVSFVPSSGVKVITVNQASVAARGAVPYTATLYLNNTSQATPYYLNDPSMEDFGNWIVQTLGAPLFRPDGVTITPAATVQSLIMGLQCEVGDTVTFRMRHLGNPEVQVLTYCSKLTHSIDIANARWSTKYELSPFPIGTVLQCDDVIQGVLTGGNDIGW